MFFIHYKRKKAVYLIGYQDNSGARTWLNFNSAQCVLISLIERESIKYLAFKILIIESSVCSVTLAFETTEILFNIYVYSSTDRKKHVNRG